MHILFYHSTNKQNISHHTNPLHDRSTCSQGLIPTFHLNLCFIFRSCLVFVEKTEMKQAEAESYCLKPVRTKSSCKTKARRKAFLNKWIYFLPGYDDLVKADILRKIFWNHLSHSFESKSQHFNVVKEKKTEDFSGK